MNSIFLDEESQISRAHSTQLWKDEQGRGSARRRITGHRVLLRVWRPVLRPEEWRTLRLFSAENEQRLKDIITTLPPHIWMTVEITPLLARPNDSATKQTTEPTTNSATTCSLWDALDVGDNVTVEHEKGDLARTLRST